MPAPIVPLALGAGLALWTLYEQQRAKEKHGAPATTPVTSLPPVPLMPGAAPYLPPVAAPEPIRNLMANALFSRNPVALRTAAKNIRELGPAHVASAHGEGRTGVSWSRPRDTSAGARSAFRWRSRRPHATLSAGTPHRS